MKKNIIIVIIVVILAVGVIYFFWWQKTKNTQNISPTTNEELNPGISPSPTKTTNENTNSIDNAISEMDKNISGINPEEDFGTFENSDAGL